MPCGAVAIRGRDRAHSRLLCHGLVRCVDEAAPRHPNAPVFVRRALDKAFALERVQPVQRRLVGGDLAAELDLADQGRLAVRLEIPLDELIDRLLLMRQK